MILHEKKRLNCPYCHGVRISLDRIRDYDRKSVWDEPGGWKPTTHEEVLARGRDGVWSEGAVDEILVHDDGETSCFVKFKGSMGSTEVPLNRDSILPMRHFHGPNGKAVSKEEEEEEEKGEEYGALDLRKFEEREEETGQCVGKKNVLTRYRVANDWSFIIGLYGISDPFSPSLLHRRIGDRGLGKAYQRPWLQYPCTHGF